MKCPKCGSERIEEGISWDATASNSGLQYRKVFIRVVPVFADLCLDCGTIVSIYIKDTTDKKWIKNETD